MDQSSLRPPVEGLTGGENVKIGLALSGGGALGAAHVGVIEELERMEVPVAAVCGTSAGAIIGLLFCHGGSRSIHAFLQALHQYGVVGGAMGLLAPPPPAMFKKLRQVLRDIVQVTSFEQFGTAFSVVATDIISGQMVVIDRGDPVDAVMASAAFPGVFDIQRLNNMLLVDGGITCNLPADVAKQQGADFVIGSSIFSLPQLSGGNGEPRISRIRSAIRALQIMQREMNAQQSRHCDFCFSPPVANYQLYDLKHIDDILSIGRDYAREEISGLMEALAEADAM